MSSAEGKFQRETLRILVNSLAMKLKKRGKFPAFVVLAAAFLIAVRIVSDTKAASGPLKPYKDDLFAYPGVLELQDNGGFMKVDYQELRDINKRDQVPERRVHRRYVSLKPNRQQRKFDLKSDGRTLETYEIGKASRARFAVIFVHGRGGDRRLGVNDWSFGGNFNRLKNLAVNNGGVYYAPSFSDFSDGGYRGLLSLVDHIAKTSPNAPIVLACGSMGSQLCWRAAHEAALAPRLAGMIILGGQRDDRFLQSEAFRFSRPLLLAHGSQDSVYPWRQQYQLYDRTRQARPDYPVRFVLFETGGHGTPIRMIDWRTSLNWILSQS